MLMFIGVILIMIIFVKVCSAHTPSTNPNLKGYRRTRQVRHIPDNRNRSQPRHHGRNVRVHKRTPQTKF